MGWTARGRDFAAWLVCPVGANFGSHWFGVAGSDAGELTLKGGSGGINHQPFRLG